MRRQLSLVLVGFVIASFSALPASAVTVKHTSGWGSPVHLDTSTGNAIIPRLAVGSQGEAIAVWSQNDPTDVSAYACRFTPASGWGTPTPIETFPTGGAWDPDVGMDSAGNAVTVWSQWNGSREGIFANLYTAGASWGTATFIEGSLAGNATLPRIAVAANGTSVAVWRLSDSGNVSLWAGVYRPGSGWGAISRVSAVASDVNYPAVVLDGTGAATAVWQQKNGTRWDIWVSRDPGLGGWQAPALLESDNAGDARYASEAADGSGNTMVVWEQTDGVRFNIWSNRYATGAGSWGGPQLVENLSIGGSYDARVATNLQGDTMAVFESWDGSMLNVYASSYMIGSGWGPAVLIEENEVYSSYLPTIALNQTGGAIAVWDQEDPYGHSVYGNRFIAGAGWGKPARLAPADSYDAGTPELGVDFAGNAIAVWYEMEGGYWNVWGNRFVLPLDEVPPGIMLTSPTEGSTLASPTVLVSGTTEPGVTLVVNGIVVDVLANGSFTVVLALAPGANIVNATAYDDWGNSASAFANVTFADPAPGMAADIAQLRSDLDNLSTQLNATRDDLAAARGELNSTSAALASTSANLNNTSASLNSTRFELSATLGELDAIRAELNETRYELAQSRYENAATRSQLNQTGDTLSALQASQNGLRVELDATTNDLTTARGNLSVATSKLDQTNSELASTRRSLSDASATLSSLTILVLAGFIALGGALAGMMRLMSRYLARPPAPAAGSARFPAPRPRPKDAEDANSQGAAEDEHRLP